MIIVSEITKGIYTVAHKTALEFGLKTIFILAGGLQRVYPIENKNMVEEILKKGELVSEFPLGVKPLIRNFPTQNRVISGLSLGIVVPKAHKKVVQKSRPYFLSQAGKILLHVQVLIV